MGGDYNGNISCWICFILGWSIYIEWIKKPRGLSKNNHIQPFVKTYVLKMSYDKEGFDYDGIGDYTYTDYRYKIFDTEKKALKYLKKNILDCNRMPSKLDTVDEFCKEYGFSLLYLLPFK